MKEKTKASSEAEASQNAQSSGDSAPETEARPSGLRGLTRVIFAGTKSSPAGIWGVRAFGVLFLASLAVAVAGVETKIEALALIGGYGVTFFGVGGAPFQLRADLDPYARITGAVLVGFSVLLGVGALMADLHGFWHPVLAAVLVGIAAVPLHVIGMARILRAPADSEPVPDLPRTASEVARSRSMRTGLALTLIGTALWLVPALLTHDPNPGYWGMLKTIGPVWYAGLVLVLIGFVIGRRHELSAGAGVLSFGLATTLTPALVYATPREQTAHKQMELTQYVLTHHYIHVTEGIYQAFSSLFSGMAWLSVLLHIHAQLGNMSLLGVATYWPVLLVLMRVAELRFLAGRLLKTTGRRWTAVMLVLLVDSLGADYFSPQSVGYVFAIGVVALAVNGVTPRPLGSRATFSLLALSGMALAPTHELSPYLAAGALIILAIFDQAPWWSGIPVALPALLWAGVVHKAVGQNFSFSALFDVSNFRPPVTVSAHGLHRLPIVGYQSHALLLALLILIVLGAIGFLANVRTRRAWAYALCPAVGLFFIVINPYGNEGIFRATLFAIPWIAVLAMMAPPPGRRIGILRTQIALTAAAGVYMLCLLGTFIVAAYAMDGTNVLPRSHVSVADYAASLPPRNAFVLVLGSADNPLDAPPFTINYTPVIWSSVATDPELERLRPTALDPIALADKYGLVADQQGATDSSPLYLVWSHSVMLYTEAYGLQSTQEMLTWLRLLKTSPDWELVDHDGGDYLFRLRY